MNLFLPCSLVEKLLLAFQRDASAFLSSQHYTCLPVASAPSQRQGDRGCFLCGRTKFFQEDVHSEEDSEEEGLETVDSRESPRDTHGRHALWESRPLQSSRKHSGSQCAPRNLVLSEKGLLLLGAGIRESREEGTPASLRYLKQLP